MRSWLRSSARRQAYVYGVRQAIQKSKSRLLHSYLYMKVKHIYVSSCTILSHIHLIKTFGDIVTIFFLPSTYISTPLIGSFRRLLITGYLAQCKKWSLLSWLTRYILFYVCIVCVDYILYGVTLIWKFQNSIKGSRTK